MTITAKRPAKAADLDQNAVNKYIDGGDFPEQPCKTVKRRGRRGNRKRKNAITTTLTMEIATNIHLAGEAKVAGKTLNDYIEDILIRHINDRMNNKEE